VLVKNRHRHAIIEQASRRWRGGRRDDSGTRLKILISTQVETQLKPYQPIQRMRMPRACAQINQ